jgi:hypothetical protein
MRLDQSTLSKLISGDRSSQWREGAQIQLESLQASDQQLAHLMALNDNAQNNMVIILLFNVSEHMKMKR